MVASKALSVLSAAEEAIVTESTASLLPPLSTSERPELTYRLISMFMKELRATTKRSSNLALQPRRQ